MRAVILSQSMSRVMLGLLAGLITIAGAQGCATQAEVSSLPVTPAVRIVSENDPPFGFLADAAEANFAQSIVSDQLCPARLPGVSVTTRREGQMLIVELHAPASQLEDLRIRTCRMTALMALQSAPDLAAASGLRPAQLDELGAPDGLRPETAIVTGQSPAGAPYVAQVDEVPGGIRITFLTLDEDSDQVEIWRHIELMVRPLIAGHCALPVG